MNVVRKSDQLPTLVAQAGPLNGQRWMVNREILIGREDSCQIVIPSRQVSRYHARLTPCDEGALLEDMGSKNGTHYNGEIVVDPVILRDGDVIQVALAQEFVFLSSEATLPLDVQPALEKARAEDAFEYRLKLDKRSRRVWLSDQELIPPLSVSQYQLLALLIDRQGRVVTRAEMVEHVWGGQEAVGVSEQALDALIRRLRDRLASVDSTHAYIVTIRGYGVRLDNPLVEY
jgi:pSer/pThr/pTyr-binding forkhead associated (FHA) protein